MAVTVHFQLDMDAEKQEEVFGLLRQLRCRSVLQPGYFLWADSVFCQHERHPSCYKQVAEPQVLEAWEKSAERREILSKIHVLLEVPAGVSLCLDSPAAVPERVCHISEEGRKIGDKRWSTHRL